MNEEIEHVDLDEAIAQAQAAFWAALGDALGDGVGATSAALPGVSALEFEQATRAAAEEWATWNSEADLLLSRCGSCSQNVRWINSPHGGWWKHESHPEDEHTAEFSLVDPR